MHLFCCMVNVVLLIKKVLRFVFILADRVHDSVIVFGGASLLDGYLCGSGTHRISFSRLPGAAFWSPARQNHTPPSFLMSSSSQTTCRRSMICSGIGKKPRPARPMSTSYRNTSIALVSWLKERWRDYTSVLGTALIVLAQEAKKGKVCGQVQAASQEREHSER